MKKKLLKITSILLTCLLLFSACSGLSSEREGEKPIDKSKSQLKVGVWDGGYNSNWAEDWAEEFEKLYEEHSFEDGKKGVQVRVEKSKSYAEDRMASTLLDASHDIIFSEQANYYEFVRQDTVYDISEWVKTPLEEYGESKSILEKLSPLDKDYYGVGQDKSTYYAMPWYCSFANISYDVDLFEDENLYFAEEGRGDSQGFVYSLGTPRSKGPDGKTGIIDGIDYSIDDGLPATFDEFFILCDRIVDKGMVPLIWAGGVKEYVNLLAIAFLGNIMGYEDATTHYTFDGTTDKLIKNIENGIITYENSVKIDDSNAYLLKKHEAYYYTLKFFHRLFTTKAANGEYKYFNYNDGYSTSFSHVAAQAKFLQSRFVDSTKSIAMLVDGTWWYNEATTIFNQLSGHAGAGQYERKIGLMSLPKPTQAHVGEEAAYINIWTTSVVVRKNINESIEGLARAFYRYCHTDKALSTFVLKANGIRPFTYELTGVDQNQLSHFALQQYKTQQNNKVVNSYSDNKLLQGYLTTIYGRLGTFKSIIGNNSYELVTSFGDSPITAEEYFKGLSSYMTPERWKGFK